MAHWYSMLYHEGIACYTMSHQLGNLHVLPFIKALNTQYSLIILSRVLMERWFSLDMTENELTSTSSINFAYKHFTGIKCMTLGPWVGMLH